LFQFLIFPLRVACPALFYCMTLNEWWRRTIIKYLSMKFSPIFFTFWTLDRSTFSTLSAQTCWSAFFLIVRKKVWNTCKTTCNTGDAYPIVCLPRISILQTKMEL
jgi:hypothetical protein